MAHAAHDGGQVVAVVVQGALRLWQGWPVDWDARALMAEVRRLARDKLVHAPVQRVHPVADEHRRLWR